MTAQAPDQLINDHATVDFAGLSLYMVIKGDIHSNHGWREEYQLPVQPN